MVTREDRFQKMFDLGLVLDRYCCTFNEWGESVQKIDKDKCRLIYLWKISALWHLHYFSIQIFHFEKKNIAHESCETKIYHIYIIYVHMRIYSYLFILWVSALMTEKENNLKGSHVAFVEFNISHGLHQIIFSKKMSINPLPLSPNVNVLLN